jgi:hypothetical protein
VALTYYNQFKGPVGPIATNAGFGTNVSSNDSGFAVASGGGGGAVMGGVASTGELLIHFTPGRGGKSYRFEKQTNGDYLVMFGGKADLVETSTDYILKERDGTMTFFKKTTGRIRTNKRCQEPF